MFTLVIDSREKNLHKELINLYNNNPINNKDISTYITTKSLDIGDAIIIDSSNNYVLKNHILPKKIVLFVGVMRELRVRSCPRIGKRGEVGVLG